MMAGQNRFRSAFTLIEMLVVITILLILVGVMIPGLSAARENAKRSTCRNNLKQIGLSFIQYAGDREGWFPLKNGGPPVYNSSGNLAGEYPFTQQVRLLYKGGYQRTAKVWVCPSDSVEGLNNNIPVAVYKGNNFAGDVSGGDTPFASQGNCSYMYVAGYGDKFAYESGTCDPTSFAVLLDESNDREQGDKTPGKMTDIKSVDNHGSGYRNVLYADGHASAVKGADVANKTIFPRADGDYKQVNSID